MASPLSFFSSIGRLLNKGFTVISNHWHRNTWLEEARNGSVRATKKFLDAFPKDEKAKRQLLFDALYHPEVVKAINDRPLKQGTRGKAFIEATRLTGNGNNTKQSLEYLMEKPIAQKYRMQAYRIASEATYSTAADLFKQKKLLTPKERDLWLQQLAIKNGRPELVEQLLLDGVTIEARLKAIATRIRLHTSADARMIPQLIRQNFTEGARLEAVRTALAKYDEKVALALLGTENAPLLLPKHRVQILAENLLKPAPERPLPASVLEQLLDSVNPNTISPLLREAILLRAASDNSLHALQWAIHPGMREGICDLAASRHMQTYDREANPQLLSLLADNMGQQVREEILTQFPWTSHPDRQNSLDLLEILLKKGVDVAVKDQLFRQHTTQQPNRWHTAFLTTLLRHGISQTALDEYLSRPDILCDNAMTATKIALLSQPTPSVSNRVMHSYASTLPLTRWDSDFIRLMQEQGKLAEGVRDVMFKHAAEESLVYGMRSGWVNTLLQYGVSQPMRDAVLEKHLQNPQTIHHDLIKLILEKGTSEANRNRLVDITSIRPMQTALYGSLIQKALDAGVDGQIREKALRNHLQHQSTEWSIPYINALTKQGVTPGMQTLLTEKAREQGRFELLDALDPHTVRQPLKSLSVGPLTPPSQRRLIHADGPATGLHQRQSQIGGIWR